MFQGVLVMNNEKILLVDDEKALTEMLRVVLKKEGFPNIKIAHNVKDAFSYCKQEQFDLIVLDIMLPDGSGFDLCPQIRQLTNAPILFLTARQSDLDKLTGFAIGGDDYITKPFNPLEVVARIKAQLRRRGLNEAEVTREQEQFSFGNVVLCERAGELTVKGQRIECPAQVFQLLLFFCKHPNQVFSKAQIYEKVWNERIIEGDENTVMVHIRRIRERIEENPSKPRHLVTVRGLGYKLMTEGTLS
jgi:DNA-binding response OmpR family regulator